MATLFKNGCCSSKGVAIDRRLTLGELSTLVGHQEIAEVQKVNAADLPDPIFHAKVASEAAE